MYKKKQSFVSKVSPSKEESKAVIAQRPEGWPEVSSDVRKLKTIGFAAGGPVALVYASALRALEDAGSLKSVEKYTGNSAGGALALYASLGYSGKEIEQKCFQQKGTDLYKVNLKWLTGLRSNLKRSGIFNGHRLRLTAQRTLLQRSGNPNLTFAEMGVYKAKAEAGDRGFFEEKYDTAMKKKSVFRKYDKNLRYDFERGSRQDSIDAMMDIAKSFRQLQLATSKESRDKDGKRVLTNTVFNEKNTPNFPVSEALRATTSYPFVFRTAKIKGDDGKFHAHADGALTSMVPFEGGYKTLDKADDTLWFYTTHLTNKESPQEKQQTDDKRPAFMQSKDGLNPEEDKRSSATNFSADKTPSRLKQKVYNLMVRQIGAIEKKAQKVRNVSAHKFGSDFIAKTHADYSKQVKEILSDKGATSHMLVFDREGIPGTQFNIDYDRKEQLMKNAYYTTWTEIEKQTGKKPEKPWDAPARDNHISTSR